jgi:glutamate synthase (NADPH/NADH) large chain
MTGGMAFVYDSDGNFEHRVNSETVVHQRIEVLHWEEQLLELITEHAHETGSAHAKEILAHWHREKGRFWQVVPREMLTRLAHPVTQQAAE